MMRHLGVGGMSSVFLARDTLRHQLVAMKVVNRATDERWMRHEIRALSHILHPNVAALKAVTEYNGQQALIMEYVAGASLRQLLRAGSALLPSLAIHVCNQVASGLRHIHSCECIHRDLKPDNIMIMERMGNFIAKIVDFGIAVVGGVDAFGANTAVGNIAGTHRYMAPEQASGEEVSAACDVFALALVVYETLIGELDVPVWRLRMQGLIAVSYTHLTLPTIYSV